MATEAVTHVGDCFEVMAGMPLESVDLVYADPPFFTQKVHGMETRDGSARYSFSDIWEDAGEYADFIGERAAGMRDVLRPTGSLFFHCDKSASHIIRVVLDKVFGAKNFQSEIIWHYKRWSNGKRGLLPAHQTIFFYSKTSDYKFNTMLQEYSPATNIDQIMQRRVRDSRNKSVYLQDDCGAVVGNGAQKGVPLSDVWEIPFLNPKAKERVGFPTQKPFLLMKRIIEIATDEGDTVLDPFCGSGSTLVASQLIGRNSIGIDIDPDAIELTERRLANPVVSDSLLMANGRESYKQHSKEAANYLHGIEYTPVQRNKGIDGLLKEEVDGLPVFIRVQRRHETIEETSDALKRAVAEKGICHLVVVATKPYNYAEEKFFGVNIIPSTSLSISESIKGEDEYINGSNILLVE